MLNFLKVRGSYLGSLFCRKLGVSLSKSRFVDSVKSALTKANFPADVFTGHNFCIVAAIVTASVASVIAVSRPLGE